MHCPAYIRMHTLAASRAGLRALPCCRATTVSHVGVHCGDQLVYSAAGTPTQWWPSMCSPVWAAVDRWNFDVFELDRVTLHRPLSALLTYIAHRHGWFARFRIPPLVFAAFVTAVEDGYCDNPYHNRIHAADVAQTAYAICMAGGRGPSPVTTTTTVATAPVRARTPAPSALSASASAAARGPRGTGTGTGMGMGMGAGVGIGQGGRLLRSREGSTPRTSTGTGTGTGVSSRSSTALGARSLSTPARRVGHAPSGSASLASTAGPAFPPVLGCSSSGGNGMTSPGRRTPASPATRASTTTPRSRAAPAPSAAFCQSAYGSPELWSRYQHTSWARALSPAFRKHVHDTVHGLTTDSAATLPDDQRASLPVEARERSPVKGYSETGSLLLGAVVDDLDLFAVVLGAALHDYRHPGLNNAHMTVTRDPVSGLFRHRAVLEQWHCAEAFSLLRNPQMDILASFPAPVRRALRHQLAALVLATDMSQHAFLEAEVLKLSHTTSASAPTSTSTSLPAPTSASLPAPASDSPGPVLDSASKQLLLRSVVHLADIGNPCKALCLCAGWAERVWDEWQLQREREARAGLPSAALIMHELTPLARSQAGFAAWVALPYLDAVTAVLRLPGVRAVAAANHAYWASGATGPGSRGMMEGWWASNEPEQARRVAEAGKATRGEEEKEGG
jgi:hypothetical protein